MSTFPISPAFVRQNDYLFRNEAVQVLFEFEKNILDVSPLSSELHNFFYIEPVQGELADF